MVPLHVVNDHIHGEIINGYYEAFNWTSFMGSFELVDWRSLSKASHPPLIVVSKH